MLTKTKKIPKKSKKNFFSKIKKNLGIWPRGSHNCNLKAIHAVTSEIIDATDGQTDGRTDHGRRTTNEFRFHELC